MTLSIPKGERNREYKVCLKEVFEDVYSTAYKKIMGLDNLIGFFQGEDMGFKTATLFSPDALREYILPWHKRFAQLAHDNGLLYILHNCGI